MNAYDQIIIKIIKEQEQLMGPVAWYEASKVKGLRVIDKEKASIVIEGNNQTVVNSLVEQYSTLFGRAAHEVCKEAVTALVADLPPSEVPASLK